MGITVNDIDDESQIAVEKDFKTIFSNAKSLFKKKVSSFADEDRIWKEVDQIWDDLDGKNELEEDRRDAQKTFEDAVKVASNERLIGERNNILSVEFLEKGLSVKNSIGKIHYPFGSGTGTFIGNGLLLTNHHVFSNISRADDYEFEMGFEQNRIGENVEEAYFKLNPNLFFLSNSELDFTIVSVGNSNNGVKPESFGYIAPTSRSEFCKSGDSASIIHHPDGDPKSISLHDSIFVSNNETDSHAIYTGDTLKGSSGAPVFDQKWNFVALHRSGVVKQNEDGELLKKDGTTFANKDDFDENQHLAKWEANLGTWCDQIITYLKTQSLPDTNQQKILDELLELWGER